MKLTHVLFGLFCILLAGCGTNRLAAMKPDVDVEIINHSSHKLENAQARFGEYVCEWGWVVKRAGYGFYPHPITAQTELSWDEDGKHRVEKFDLSKIYKPGKAGRLTFTVYDGRAEVGFREEGQE